MKFWYKFVILFIFLLFIVTSLPVEDSFALSDSATTNITEWEMIWEEDPYRAAQNAAPTNEASGWQSFSSEDDLPLKPANIHSAWLRFKLPANDFARPSLYITKLTAKDVSIFINKDLVYKSERNYPYNKNEILLSVTESEANQMVYILLKTNSDWLGLNKPIMLGEEQMLNKSFMKKEILDVVIGGAFIFSSFAMFLCFIFMNKSYLAGLNSLSFVIFSIGVMILALSPYLHRVYNDYGFAIYYMFDIGSALVVPSLFFFFERIFGRGPLGLITRFRKFQVVLSILTVLFLLSSFFSSKIAESYIAVTTISFAFSIVFGNFLILFCLIRFCLQRNRDAQIITTGYGIFAIIGVLEVMWYFIQGMNYDLFLWKFGIFSFIASLVIILARRIVQNYEQLISYSKQLEVFNNELQRSEKMEIISQLAASVAHEVRNPLQVTRGFLQLLRGTSVNDKEKSFMLLAIEELDRASDIITDFLTFAKPQIDHTVLLDVSEELQKIEGILIPLANMQGGIIKVDLSPNLYVRGNSSKLKQALINIIKNSIEALDTGGVIQIYTFMDDSKNVIINIKDNGEGIDEKDLKRLGEPYYSKKTKGTGLGLMVTFRIIEVMQGKVEFFSTKGVGTEVVIQIPSAKK